MATRDTVGAKVDPDIKREVNEYKEREGLDNESDAVRQLLRVGLRESTNPLVFRLKDRMVDWVSWLGISAIIVVIAGGTTTVIHIADAAKLAIALVGAAIVLLGCYELLRVSLGMNRVGSGLRELFSGDQA